MKYPILLSLLLLCPLTATALDTEAISQSAEQGWENIKYGIGVAAKEVSHQWGELTEFSKESYTKTSILLDDHMNPNPPEPVMPQKRDMQKSCSELYYELSGLSVYSTDPGPQLLSNPYDFITDPVNRAAIAGAMYYSSALYYVIPVNGVMADKRNRTVRALKHRQEMLRSILARKQCYQ